MCAFQERIKRMVMQFIRFVRLLFGGGTKLSAEDGFLQFMIERLLASSAPAEIVEDEDEEETGGRDEADKHSEHH